MSKLVETILNCTVMISGVLIAQCTAVWCMKCWLKINSDGAVVCHRSINHVPALAMHWPWRISLHAIVRSRTTNALCNQRNGANNVRIVVILDWCLHSLVCRVQHCLPWSRIQRRLTFVVCGATLGHGLYGLVSCWTWTRVSKPELCRCLRELEIRTTTCLFRDGDLIAQIERQFAWVAYLGR